MIATEPRMELDHRFSDSNAAPTSWEAGLSRLQEAGVYWISSTRADGSPHVTTIAGVILDGEFYFCTGADEQKARNLARNSRCAVFAGCDSFDEGLDIVIEGAAVRVTDESLLNRLADEYRRKYDGHFDFLVQNGAFAHEADGPSNVPVFQVVPTKGFGFAKGEPFSQTRWRFAGVES